MKKLIYTLLVVITITACKQRHFMESSEIDSFKAVLAAYESGDLEAWKGHFADTAKIYHNTKNGVSVEDNLKSQQEMIANFSSYGFDNDDDYMEMVIDGENETWVYYWADWNGTLKANGKTLSVPVHLAVQYVNGKAVEEYGYWDNTPINEAFAAIAAENAAAAAENMVEEVKE